MRDSEQIELGNPILPDGEGPTLEPRRSRRWPWIVVLLLGLGGAGGWWYTTRTASGDPKAGAAGGAPGGSPTDGRSGQGQGRPGRKDGDMRPATVATALVTTADVDVHLNGLGTVVPRNVILVRSRVDGELVRVEFREGDMVKKGDLLALIDTRPYDVLLTQAKGQLVKDEALLKNARVDLARYRQLWSEDSIPKQQLDTQEALVRQYEGSVEADRGQVDSANLQLTYCRIVAPVSGRTGLRQVDPGNIVHASDSTGIVTITQISPITVVFTLPEDSVPNVMAAVRTGHALPVEAWDRAQRRKLATGTLLTIDNQIDTTTGTVKLKADFANEDSSLFPNQFVNARMTVDTRRGVVVIPSPALLRGTQGPYTYVVRDDKTVTVRPVKPGPVEGALTVIEDGLKPGETVVTDGTDKLREGAKIELAQPITPAGATGRGAGKPGADGQQQRRRPRETKE